MSNHYRRSAASKLHERLLDKSFALGVETACCLIKNDYWGIFEETAGNAYPLFLPSGKTCTAFPYLGIEPIR